ncbi:MAG TPA: amino acid adenylation domain-containing protein, partial [Pyrinomonadaceae bacterium]
MKNVEDIYPLSPMQQGLLFHSLYSPESGFYVQQLSCSFGAGLEAEAFVESWRRVVERHPALRASFVWEGLDEALQVVRREVELPLERRDWRAMSEEARRESFEALLEDDRRRGFDLSEAPLMRLYLIRTGADAYRFLWSSHHILLDGWSLFSVLQELFAAYDALTRREEVRAERRRPFRDYIEWLQRQDRSEAESYWRRELAGFVTPTPLGVERAAGDPRGREGEESYGRRQFSLTEELTGELQALARRHRLTLNTLVQGAWALLLSLYSREKDVVFGMTVSGRPAELAGVEGMVGLFINTLPVRVQAPGGETLLSWLKELQARQSRRQQFDYTALVDIQGWSEVERGQPLFESILGFENYPVDEALKARAAGLQIGDVRFSEKTNFALNIAAIPGPPLSLDILYSSRRFDAATIERLGEHFRALLEGFAARPEQKLSDLCVLTEGERREMLSAWNETRAEYPTDKCLHELFEAQARLRPDAPALSHEGREVSYGELNRRANALARRLRALGVGPGSLVALLSGRSAETVAALLGVLKAGGAYVPLDPDYPRERLAFTLEDARPAVVLTTREALANLPETAARVIILDAEWTRGDVRDEENLENLARPDDLAYVIYTSGSTGRPKGVLIPHRSVVNHNFATAALYELSPRDRVLQFASLSFDVAVEEIFPTWLRGGCVVLRTDDVLDSHAAFFRLLESERVSVVNLTTPYWNELMAELARTNSRVGESLRVAAIGGEKGLPEGFALAKRLVGERVRLLNVYGPTETTVTNTAYEFKGEAKRREYGSVPIGRPIANTSVYVLNEHLQPLPVGVGGEVFIGGYSLARGYLGRPALTAERFVPDPFGAKPGARLYRSGDLGRFLHDGNVEFLGRVDNQVKVRGFRIELGEIEAMLTRHASVREAVVIVREDGGAKRVVAYVVPDEGRAPTPGELRAFVAERLPEYMTPSAFVTLEALPLTSNGKVNRRLLPAPEQAEGEPGTDYAAPRTPVEEMLAGMWSEVLGVGRPGVHDDFFESGGHSLLATQLMSRLREAFGVEVALRQLFESPTIAELARHVEGVLRAGAGPEAPPILPAGNAGAPPLSFAQQRLWFLDQLEPGGTLYNVPVALRLGGRLEGEVLARVLTEVVRRHESLRTTFAVAGGQPAQVIHPASEMALEVEDLGAFAEAEREAEAQRLLNEEAARPFDLSAGPLLRARLLRLSDEEHVLLLTMHHIVTDGWSMGILVKEVARLYEAFLKGEASPLPELPVQYADFAAWQREWMQGEVLERELSYWRKQLEGAPPVLELPTDKPRPAVQTANCEQHRFRVPAELTSRLREVSREEGVTLFMTLLAGFQALLSRYTNQQDVVVGADVANRNRAETEGLIGFFVNMLVLRTDLSGSPSFRELLRRARETCLGAYAHQDVPFEKLVEELEPERSLGRNPLFQAAFVLQNAPLGELSLPGVSMSIVESDNYKVAFDLLLDMREAGDVIDASLVYNADLFEAATAERMARHLVALLSAAAQDPSLPVESLEVLSGEERHLLADVYNRTASAYPREASLASLFERRAALSPDVAALAFGDGLMSYADLNEKANRLARHLRSLGVGAETRVGVLMERSAELVVSLLAVLKAGGAYVPLDPEYPLERLSFMLEDSRAPVLLTQSHLLDSAPSYWGQVVSLDDDLEQELSALPGDDLPEEERGVGGSSLAYVIYTSGSTGRPKGVMVEQRSVARLVCNTDYAALGPDEVFLQLAPVSFDASTFELWGALLNGGRLAVMPPGPVTVEALDAALRRHGVTTLWLTAGLFHVVVDERPAALAGLRQLLAGGDVLSPPHVERALLAGGGRLRVINGYGPTEGTTFTCCHEARPGGRAPVPVGRPVANTRVYVLDGRMGLAPEGVAGELYAGGDGVARGYLNAA